MCVWVGVEREGVVLWMHGKRGEGRRGGEGGMGKGGGWEGRKRGKGIGKRGEEEDGVRGEVPWGGDKE